MAKIVNIIATKVPNPEAMKFVVENLLLTRGAFEYPDAASAKESPLAQKLFNFDYVDRVFIAKNFVTVHKKSEPSFAWEEIQSDLRIIIKKHLEFGEPLFDFDSRQVEEGPEPEDELSKKISQVIEEAIMPATWQDGGEITFSSFEDGVVKVHLAGACVKCPFAPRTLKHGVEKVLKDTFPEVQEVTSDQVNWEETQS